MKKEAIQFVFHIFMHANLYLQKNFESFLFFLLNTFQLNLKVFMNSFCLSVCLSIRPLSNSRKFNSIVVLYVIEMCHHMLYIENGVRVIYSSFTGHSNESVTLWSIAAVSNLEYALIEIQFTNYFLLSSGPAGSFCELSNFLKVKVIN